MSESTVLACGRVSDCEVLALYESVGEGLARAISDDATICYLHS